MLSIGRILETVTEGMGATMNLTIRIAAALLLLAAVPAIAGATDDTDNEEIVVYTNADIEKLEPLPTGQPLAHTEFDAEAWAFVSNFVDREWARITEDRDHELERDLVTIEADRPVGYGERYPYYLRVPHYDPLPRAPRLVHDADPGPDPTPPTRVPHPMFRDRPPVREFTPGLGNSYRGRPKK